MSRRRIHISHTLATPGELIVLDESQARHVRDALRMEAGDEVELFDGVGNVAAAVIRRCEPHHVSVEVQQLCEKPAAARIIVASAIPKGDRADWMIEKLSELGVARFVPLSARRSVVLPAGQNKRDRWVRIATESAKQSRRSGVMKIDELTALSEFLQELTGSTSALVLSTQPDAKPITEASAWFDHHMAVTLLIGPEGGWADEELSGFATAGLTAVRLTRTILRVETAAVAAAAVVACLEK